MRSHCIGILLSEMFSIKNNSLIFFFLCRLQNPTRREFISNLSIFFLIGSFFCFVFVLFFTTNKNVAKTVTYILLRQQHCQLKGQCKKNTWHTIVATPRLMAFIESLTPSSSSSSMHRLPVLSCGHIYELLHLKLTLLGIAELHVLSIFALQQKLKLVMFLAVLSLLCWKFLDAFYLVALCFLHILSQNLTVFMREKKKIEFCGHVYLLINQSHQPLLV